MKPEPNELTKKKPRLRPKARNLDGHRRCKSIQVKLSEEEYDVVHSKYGRAAAAIAREHWLGFELKAAEAPNAGSVMPMARALYACQVDIEHLTRHAKVNQTGDSFGKTLKLLTANFQHLIRTWYSNFSREKK